MSSPSLSRVVEGFSVSIAESRSGAKYDYRTPTFLAASPNVVFLRYDDERLTELVEGLSDLIAFDLEWATKSGIDVISLADEKTALIIQTTGCGERSFPSAIRRLMENGQKKKIGGGIVEDATRLGTVFEVVPRHLVDLSEYAKSVDKVRWPDRGKAAIGLVRLCAEYVGKELVKDPVIQCGNWAGTLAVEQIDYAVCDVVVAIDIFHALEALRRAYEALLPFSTNFADFTFNCDWRTLDEASKRHDNADLARFKDLKDKAKAEQRARVDVTAENISTGLSPVWEGRVTIDGVVVARSEHSKSKRAQGAAAKIAMETVEWEAWLALAYPRNE